MVEVVIALAVATFGLIAVFGLFSVGMRTSRQSGDATTLAALSLRVADGLRSGTASTVNVTTNLFFDRDGAETNAASAYYACLLTTAFTSLPVGNLSTNFVTATLKFSWPAAAPAAAQAVTNVFATAPYRP